MGTLDAHRVEVSEVVRAGSFRAGNHGRSRAAPSEESARALRYYLIDNVEEQVELTDSASY